MPSETETVKIHSQRAALRVTVAKLKLDLQHSLLVKIEYHTSRALTMPSGSRDDVLALSEALRAVNGVTLETSEEG